MRIVNALLLLSVSVPAFAQQSYIIDWDAVGEEAVQHLVELVRIDTTNPPGNETRVVEYLEQVLDDEGIASRRFALEPDRANLIARREGN